MERLRAREAATGTGADIHERDGAYLMKCREAGLAAAAHYGWNVVGAFSGDEARTAEDIHDEIYSIIKGA